MPRSLYLFDWLTHYTGYYTSGTSAVITGISGAGQPYVMFGGFSTIYNDLPIKIEGPYGTVKSNISQFCPTWAGGALTIYNFNGQSLGNCTFGIQYSTSILPHGTHIFKITVDDDVLIYTIIRQ